MNMATGRSLEHHPSTYHERKTALHRIAHATLHLLPGLCLATQLIAQAPSFNASSVWHEELWRYQGLEAHHFVYTITVTGDTMIGGLLYQKLHEEGTHTFEQLLGTPPPRPDPTRSLRADPGCDGPRRMRRHRSGRTLANTAQSPSRRPHGSTPLRDRSLDRST